MKRVDLVKVSHDVKVGDKCNYMEPNVTESCLLYENDELVGFYLKDMPERATKLANLCNHEFLSDNVPKSMMNRSSAVSALHQGKIESYADDVQQFATILGSCAPKPHMKRPFPIVSSVHGVKSAQVFVKAMLMLAIESERIMKEIAPELHQRQVEAFADIPEKWRFGNIFTSSISNYNIAASYHRDAANLVGACNVIITKRRNSKGGCLSVPDYGIVTDAADNSMLVYPAWRNVHGVTPIIPTHPDGYRNSLVFYPLKAFKGL